MSTARRSRILFAHAHMSAIAYYCQDNVLLALRQRVGLLCTGIFAKKIILSKTRGDKLRARTATGVLAETAAQPGCGGGRRWQIIIRAHYVVSSAGALHTPALLLRSGIKVNGNVGKNLRLHPATAVIGIFSKVSACWQSLPHI